jgi:hypothetical protein
MISLSSVWLSACIPVVFSLMDMTPVSQVSIASKRPIAGTTADADCDRYVVLTLRRFRGRLLCKVRDRGYPSLLRSVHSGGCSGTL